MSVYVVNGGFDYDGDEVMGAYSTLEAAAAAMNKHAESEWKFDRYTIMCCVLDSNDEPNKSAWRRTRP